MTDEDLRDIAYDAMIDRDADSTDISEMLWDRHDDPESVTEEEWDELMDRVFALCGSAKIDVSWTKED